MSKEIEQLQQEIVDNLKEQLNINENIILNQDELISKYEKQLQICYNHIEYQKEIISQFTNIIKNGE
jgi:hypothetical protein